MSRANQHTNKGAVMTQIVIDRERAIVLCEAYTRWRDSCVSALREPMIQKAMRHTWWQKLIGKPPRTRDEAIAHLRRGSLFDSYNILDYGTGEQTPMSGRCMGR